MPTKFEREIEEILERAGTVKARRPSPLARLRGRLVRVRGSLRSLWSIFPRLSSHSVQIMASLGLFLFLVGLVLRSVEKGLGNSLTLVGLGLLALSLIAYAVRPYTRRPRYWRGRDVRRRR